VFFSIGILPFLFVFKDLFGMCLLGRFSYHSLLPLHLSVIQYLHSSHLLLLQGPQLLLLFFLLLHHLLFFELLFPFVHNITLLLIIESLEVIRLNTVIGQLRLSGGWVLGHEIIGQCVVSLMILLIKPIFFLFRILVSLLLSL
jgi:hypothetical protein